MDTYVDISGIDKAELLAALFNNSRHQGMGFLDSRGEAPMSVEDARAVIQTLGLGFDYLRGRVMKIDLGSDLMNARLYDRDMGEGAAARVVAKLRRQV